MNDNGFVQETSNRRIYGGLNEEVTSQESQTNRRRSIVTRNLTPHKRKRLIKLILEKGFRIREDKKRRFYQGEIFPPSDNGVDDLDEFGPHSLGFICGNSLMRTYSGIPQLRKYHSKLERIYHETKIVKPVK